MEVLLPARALDISRDGGTAAEIMRELDRVEAEVGKLQVPLGYGESYYNLRMHMHFIRRVIPPAKRVSHPAAPGDSTPEA